MGKSLVESLEESAECGDAVVDGRDTMLQLWKGSNACPINGLAGGRSMPQIMSALEGNLGFRPDSHLRMWAPASKEKKIRRRPATTLRKD